MFVLDGVVFPEGGNGAGEMKAGEAAVRSEDVMDDAVK